MRDGSANRVELDELAGLPARRAAERGMSGDRELSSNPRRRAAAERREWCGKRRGLIDRAAGWASTRTAPGCLPRSLPASSPSAALVHSPDSMGMSWYVSRHAPHVPRREGVPGSVPWYGRAVRAGRRKGGMQTTILPQALADPAAAYPGCTLARAPQQAAERPARCAEAPDRAGAAGRARGEAKRRRSGVATRSAPPSSSSSKKGHRGRIGTREGGRQMGRAGSGQLGERPGAGRAQVPLGFGVRHRPCRRHVGRHCARTAGGGMLADLEGLRPRIEADDVATPVPRGLP